MTTTSVTHYRIVSRPPGQRTFTFRSFTGARDRDLDRLRRRMERAYQESPDGWDFRIEQREVVSTSTPWNVVAR